MACSIQEPARNRDLFQSLSCLKQCLINENVGQRNEVVDGRVCRVGKPTKSREEILEAIEDVVYRVTKDISDGASPSFVYASTSSWSDVRFERGMGLEIKRSNRLTSVKFESQNSVKKFGLMMKVLSIMYRLVKTGNYCTKRDIYYQDPSLFGNQHTLDGIVDNISCMLQVPRWDLHVLDRRSVFTKLPLECLAQLATSKGCVAGDLVFLDADNNLIDCRNTKMGIQVPTHVCGMHNVKTEAMFVLVVEKDATFQKLLQDRVCDKLKPCIVITGKGFPDINTRMLLRKLWDNFQLPILALVDADPHGVEIMAVYKFGSKALSFDTDQLAVPCMRWLGLLPSDIHRLGIPQGALTPLTKADEDKGRELLSRPYMEFFPLLRQEVETLLRANSKAELQSLDAISPSFLCDVYLPSKIRCSGWL